MRDSGRHRVAQEQQVPEEDREEHLREAGAQGHGGARSGREGDCLGRVRLGAAAGCLGYGGAGASILHRSLQFLCHFFLLGFLGSFDSLTEKVVPREIVKPHRKGRENTFTCNECQHFLSESVTKAVFKSCKRKTQKFCKSLAWCTKCSQKINRITKMDCKSRNESNEPNYDVIKH